MVCSTISSHQATSVNTKHDMKFLEGNIMNYLIVGPLDKRGIYIAEWYHPLCCKSGRKSNSMLLCYTHIKCPFRHFFHHDIKRTACCHSRCNTYYLIVELREFKDRISKNFLI